MNVKKFKIENSSKGIGTVSLEKGKTEEKDLILLTFRNTFGSLLFQGQLVKNVSKFIKYTSAKTYKVQRMIRVVGKKDNANVEILKCIITVSAFLNNYNFLVQS